MYKKLFLIILCLLLQKAYAGHIEQEKYYQDIWCNEWKGAKEYMLPDKTRVDCLTDTYAVEFDFAPKWAEAVGQSLYYSKITGKKAAIILIIEKENDFKYFNRAKLLADDNNIQLWYMKSSDYTKNIKPVSFQHNTEINIDIEKIIKWIFTVLDELTNIKFD